MPIGDLATWISGLATLAAVCVALYYSMRSEARASEAINARVYAWALHQGAAENWCLIVTNLTDAPVYTWQVKLTWVATSGAELSETISDADGGLLVPGQQSYNWTPSPPPENDALVKPELTFVDARGIRYRRDERGKLSKVGRLA